MIKTCNIQLTVSKQSIGFWNNLLTEAMDAYNTCCNYLVNNKVTLGLHEVHEAVYNMLRTAYPSLPAQSVVKLYKEAIAAIRSQKSNFAKQYKKDSTVQWRTPQKHNKSIHLDKRLYANLDASGISITGEVKNKRTRYSFVCYEHAKYLFEHYVAKDPTLFIRDNKLYISIPFEVPEHPVLSNTSVGVDLGVKRLFTTSEGYAFRDKTYLRERRKVRYSKRCLASKGTKSAKRHRKHLKHRERNLCKDMCHRAVNALLQSTNASYIVMEDLSGIKSNSSKNKVGMQASKHNNVLSQVPFYQFRQILTYKAQLVGKQVATVSPAYTSQTDSRTNKRDGKRVGCRYYCSDGIVFDADFNASVNIAQRSSHPLSCNKLPFDGRLLFLSGRHQSMCQTPSNTMCCGASPLHSVVGN